MIDCIATPTQAYPIVTLSPHGQVEYNPDYPLCDILLNDTQNIYAKRVCPAVDENVIVSLRVAYEKADKFLAAQFPVLRNKYGRNIVDGAKMPLVFINAKNLAKISVDG